MGLMGVFVAMLLPDFNRVIPEMKVEKAASKVAADLRVSRQKAIAEMSYVRFLINPGGIDGPDNGYKTEVWDRDYVYTSVPGQPVQDPLKGASALVIDLDTTDPFVGVVISSAATEIRFTPIGTIVSNVDQVITLTHTQTGYSRQVIIYQPLGKIEVLP